MCESFCLLHAPWAPEVLCNLRMLRFLIYSLMASSVLSVRFTESADGQLNRNYDDGDALSIDDSVLILTGKYKGCEGVVEKASSSKNKVKVRRQCGDGRRGDGKAWWYKPGQVEELIEDEEKRPGRCLQSGFEGSFSSSCLKVWPNFENATHRVNRVIWGAHVFWLPWRSSIGKRTVNIKGDWRAQLSIRPAMHPCDSPSEVLVLALK